MRLAVAERHRGAAVVAVGLWPFTATPVRTSMPRFLNDSQHDAW